MGFVKEAILKVIIFSFLYTLYIHLTRCSSIKILRTGLEIKVMQMCRKPFSVARAPILGLITIQ